MRQIMIVPIIFYFVMLSMMVSARKLWIRIAVMTVVACLCFSCARVSADVDSLISTLYDRINANPGQLANLISDYCSVVLSAPSASDPFVKDNYFVYNAKRSSFVYLLCSNMSSVAPYSNLSDKYFKRTSFAEL